MEHPETAINPDQIWRVKIFYEPLGREHRRVTVEYTASEVRTCSSGFLDKRAYSGLR